jgi:branched-chain amino acid transport system ATP-binding protein
VSFGHGAWFGLAAYFAGLTQRHLFPGSFFLPLAFAVGGVALVSLVFGGLILRRRGVYFSLLTLALSAMLYVVAFRWTAVTGGEEGFGGIARPQFLGVDFESGTAFYPLVAAIAFAVSLALWRFHRSPAGHVLVAIRENEQRARFIGYPTNRYKLLAFVMSASVTGLAGALLLFNNRMTSAEPISVIFSGELLAMVIIGGMRSFLGPALGALFFIIFRDFLSGLTPHWLLYFGILFVTFIMVSPTGLVGLYARLTAPFRPQPVLDAAMASRKAGRTVLPDFLKVSANDAAANLKVEGVSKRFGNLKAVDAMSLSLEGRVLHALIGPNGAGKTTAFNLVSGLHLPDEGVITLGTRDITRLSPEARTTAGIGRSFQITNLFPALSVEDNVRLAIQARSPHRFSVWRYALGLTDVLARTRALMTSMGLVGIEKAEAESLSYGGQRLLDMTLALASGPKILLLDEPLAGLSASERDRISTMIKSISADMPVLLIEHDIDKVFLVADTITVMNDGRLLARGDAEAIRNTREVQEVYIGSGKQMFAVGRRSGRTDDEPRGPLLSLQSVDSFYGKSHILRNVSFTVERNEIVALLGRNGAGKSTLLKTIIGIVTPASGSIVLDGMPINGLPPARIARQGVAYVPQGRGLFSGMSVAENLALGRLKRQAGSGRRWDEEKIFEFFPRIRQRLDIPADMLSGGEQQMVAIARALSGTTRLLLLDEPFEGLAPAVIEELFRALDRLREDLSIIIVDHHLELALALSDRTVALETGAISHVGASTALADDIEMRRRILWL